jgi:alpha-L-rhamnosidase
MYNYDMAHFYRKTVRDFANEQQPDGGITEIAPYTGIADRGYGGESGPLGWQLAFPFVQKKLYEFYGDKDIIEKNYEGVKKQMAFLESKAINGLFHWDISDHESLEPTPEAFSASSFYYHHAVLAAEFAAILAQKEDSAKYTRLAARIKGSIVRKFLIPATGRFDLATQATQLFALWYNLSPEKEKTTEVLLAELARHKDHVSTGIFATKFMFDVFRETDQNEIAYNVVNQKTIPGGGICWKAVPPRCGNRGVSPIRIHKTIPCSVLSASGFIGLYWASTRQPRASKKSSSNPSLPVILHGPKVLTNLYAEALPATGKKPASSSN